MAKAGDLDWSDLISGQTGLIEDIKSRAFKPNYHKDGKPSDEEIMKEAQSIIDGFNANGIKQCSDSDMKLILKMQFPYLAIDDNELKKMKFTDSIAYDKLIKTLHSVKVQATTDERWEDRECKSFNSSLSREEILDRNMCTDNDE